MATARFVTTGIMSMVMEVETWVKMMAENIRVKSNSVEIPTESGWKLELKKQQSEPRMLYHSALRKLIPMAGAYQLRLLDHISQATTLYSPEVSEAISLEANKRMEEVGNHITSILYNARKMREAGRQADKLADTNAKALAYHKSVAPYTEALRFHISRLDEILRIAI